MVRSRSQQLFVRNLGGGRQPDDLVVEEPMTIQLDGHDVSSTMRTPGHDFELAVGFLLAEGLITGTEVAGIRYCGTGSPVDSEFNVVTVETGGQVDAPTARMGTISSSCGICGIDAIETLTERLRVLPPYQRWDLETLIAGPDLMRAAQPLFDATGAVHAAASMNRAGDILVVREDIGRHNAVDKVVGRMVMDDLIPASPDAGTPNEADGGAQGDYALVVSGRASFEMVQKAWAAGFTALVAVSGPSSLAVSTARRAGLTVLGFARDGQAKIYSPLEIVD